MPTTVKNIKKGEAYDTYIGRKGHGFDGYFGNPHPVGFCDICQTRHKRGEAILAFKKDFRHRIQTDPEFKRRVEELRGKRLGCFCKPDGCHGDVYVEYLDGSTDNPFFMTA